MKVGSLQFLTLHTQVHKLNLYNAQYRPSYNSPKDFFLCILTKIFANIADIITRKILIKLAANALHLHRKDCVGAHAGSVEKNTSELSVAMSSDGALYVNTRVKEKGGTLSTDCPDYKLCDSSIFTAASQFEVRLRLRRD